MSQGYNKVIMIGNLTRDPEVRETANGTAVCEFGLAVNEKRSDKDKTCFVDVTVWGKVGEACSNNLSKGAPVLLEGRLTFSTWPDAVSGKRKSKHGITAFNVQFLGDKPERKQAEPEPEQPAPTEPGVSDEDNLPF